MAIRYITMAEVVHLHHQGMLAENQSAALAASDKLESAVLRPQAEAFGEEFYPTLAEKASALLQGIVIAHAFVDGNKRAAASRRLI
jgi:death-on-curing protein